MFGQGHVMGHLVPHNMFPERRGRFIHLSVDLFHHPQHQYILVLIAVTVWSYQLTISSHGIINSTDCE